MKIYALLLYCSVCLASEKEVHITNNNNITLTNTQAPRHVVRPGEKHPAVEEAHERARREQEERDALTCCCFIRIKKRL